MLDGSEIDEIRAAFRDGWVTGGPRVARFETALRSYLGVEHLAAVTSCTAAMTLALIELGVGPGDEVLVPAITFVACANVLEHRGAVPVFVDVDPRTGLVDLEAARAAVTARTKAICVVHLHGRPMDMDACADFTRETGVPILEDAAHAIGARWRSRPIGAFGNLTAFSFHATKNVTTIDGGALVSTTPQAHADAKLRARQGMTRPSWERHDDPAPGIYDVVEPGFKFAMHDVSAAVGLQQLRKIEPWTMRRLELAALYDDLLAGITVERPADVPAHARNAMHVYSVRVPGGAPARNRIARDLRDRGIGTSVHFRALHHHTYYARKYELAPADLPAATAFSDASLSLPMHPGLSDDDVHQVVATLRDALAA